MTYKQTLDYMYSQLPMFHRTGPAAYKANLDNTIAICDALQNPQDHFRSVHIAGTNGKGSTSHMLAAILQTAGYRTGLYTSPHLRDFRERIRIDGKMIPKAFISGFVAAHRELFDRIKPSFFEMTVGLCFDYFSSENVDVAVIETGLGGRLDSTNVISPLLSVITNIGYDHTSLLGNTLPEIAAEKAGIIKPGVPVVIGETHPETKDLFKKTASEKQASLFFADQIFKASDPIFGRHLLLDISCGGLMLYRNLELDLTGSYQAKNVLTVLQAVSELREQGLHITEEHIRQGLQHVQKITGLEGRWQTIGRRPLTICDTGHNADGIKEVLKNIARIPHEKLHFVLGMVNDKDISGILELLPRKAAYYFCKADIPRGLPAEELKERAEKFSLSGEAYASVKEALEQARKKASVEDLVFVGGSTFTVAEAL